MKQTLAAGAALGIALGLIACDNRTLRVTSPDVVQPSSLQSAAALPSVTAAVYGDFGYAYAGDGGDDEGIIEQSGLLGDEWHSSDTFPTRNQIDIRLTTTDNAQLESIFRRIQRARATAENAYQSYQQFEPGAALQGEALIYSALAHLMAGENYCSGIPFSTVSSTGAVTYGPFEATAQVWGDAHARLDSAMAILNNDLIKGKDTINADTVGGFAQVHTDINFANVVLGRMLLDSGDYADAATAVASVPDGFVFNQGYSASNTRVNNGVWEYNLDEGRFSVADSEGIVGLPYRTANDPRVLWVNSGTQGFDHVTELYIQLKYNSRGASIPVATDIEARLIEAEAALQAGSMGTFLAKINQARVDAGDTQVATGVPAGMTAAQFLFQERAFGLWLTAHRLGDMRRSLLPPYNFAANAVYPNGPYPKGGSYGPEITLPIPIAELANPNYKACNDQVP